jgi:hypothetical protein
MATVPGKVQTVRRENRPGERVRETFRAGHARSRWLFLGPREQRPPAGGEARASCRVGGPRGVVGGSWASAKPDLGRSVGAAVMAADWMQERHPVHG